MICGTEHDRPDIADQPVELTGHRRYPVAGGPVCGDAARAVGVPVPYRPAPGVAVYHIRVDDYVVVAAEDDLAGPLLDLVTAVMALGLET